MSEDTEAQIVADAIRETLGDVFVAGTSQGDLPDYPNVADFMRSIAEGLRI